MAGISNEQKKSIAYFDSFLLKSTMVGFYVDKHVRRHIGPHVRLPRERLAQHRLESGNPEMVPFHLDAIIKVQSLWRQKMAL